MKLNRRTREGLEKMLLAFIEYKRTGARVKPEKKFILQSEEQERQIRILLGYISQIYDTQGEESARAFVKYASELAQYDPDKMTKELNDELIRKYRP